MENDRQGLKIFYDGQIRSVSEAGALIMRQMIEEDLIRVHDFPAKENPYRWLESKIYKSERTIRRWAYDWESPSGAQPTFADVLRLVHITKSSRLSELLKDILSGATPEELKHNHGNVIKKMAHHVRELADKLEELAEEY